MQIIASNSISILILLFYTLSFTIQPIGNVCLADTNKFQGHDLNISQNMSYTLYKTTPAYFLKIVTNNKEDTFSQDKYVKFAVVVIENRFIATGTILEIKRASKGVQKFTMKIKGTKQFKDYPNFGANYLEKEVEIFSEIGIPDTFSVGTHISVLLRLSGDEHGQYLFLVEIIENEEKD